MILRSDGTGVYEEQPDSSRRYANSTHLKIDGQLVYRFDLRTGVLQLSISEGDLEILLEREIGELPEEGKDITLNTPYDMMAPARFLRVKYIEPFPELPEEQCLLKLQKPEKTPE